MSKIEQAVTTKIQAIIARTDPVAIVPALIATERRAELAARRVTGALRDACHMLASECRCELATLARHAVRR